MDDEFVKFEYHWRFGSRVEAREIAKKWVEEHAQSVEQLEWYKPEGLVALVEKYRAAGQESNRIAVDMWLVTRNQAPIGEERILPLEALPEIPIEQEDWELLNQFRAAWRKGTQTDRDAARSLAKSFIETHYGTYSKIFLRGTMEDLVQWAESFRAYRKFAEVQVIEMWLLCEYKPQNIVGEFSIGVSEMMRALNRARKE